MKDIIIDGIVYDNYKVDELGNVYTNYRCPQYRPISKSKGEYLSVTLYEKGVSKSISIHRIVALTFIPNPLNLPEVNHKDGDKWNNHYKNLEWSTSSDNIKHAYSLGLINIKRALGEDSGLTKLKNEDVVFIYINPDKKTNKELSNITNVSIDVIRRIWDGRCWSHITSHLTPKYRSKNGKVYECKLS